MTMRSPFHPQLMMAGSQGQGAAPSGAPLDASAKLPPRPYTEYTIFFRIERARLLQSSAGLIDDEALPFVDPNHHDPLEFPRPERWAKVVMPPYWYSASHKAVIEKKRKHRKREGRMDLQTLSKSISANWRGADKEVVEYCRKIAKAELDKYNAHIMALGLDNLPKIGSGKTEGPPKKGQEKKEPTPDGALFAQGQSQAAAAAPLAFGMNALNAALVQGGAFLKMIQMQQLQNLRVAAAMGLCGNAASPDQAASSSPAPQLQAVAARSFPNERPAVPAMCHSTASEPKSQLHAVAAQSFPNAAEPKTVISQPTGLEPPPPPAKRRRSLIGVRRASAPAECMFDADGVGIKDASPKDLNGGPPPAAAGLMRRRASVSSLPDMDGQELLALRRMREAQRRQQQQTLNPFQGIKTPFQQADLLAEPTQQSAADVGGSFSWVPRWEREDAATLLDVLNASDHSDGIGGLLRDGGGFASPAPPPGGFGAGDEGAGFLGR